MHSSFRLTESIYRPRCRANRSATGGNALPARACLNLFSTVLRISVIFCYLSFLPPHRSSSFWAAELLNKFILLFDTCINRLESFNLKNCNLQSAKTTFFKCAENRLVASSWCEEEFEGFLCWNHWWSSILERGGEIDDQQSLLRSKRVIFRQVSL